MTGESTKIGFIEKTEDEVETTMPQLSHMTKAAWAVFEIQCVNPRATQVEIAAKCNLTRPYVSRIVNSEVYKAEIRKMRRSMLESRLETLGDSSVKRLTDIVESSHSEDKDAIKAAEIGLEAIGVIGKNSQIQVNVAQPTTEKDLGVTADMVKEAARRRKNRIVDGEFTEVADGEVQEESKDS